MEVLRVLVRRKRLRSAGHSEVDVEVMVAELRDRRRDLLPWPETPAAIEEALRSGAAPVAIKRTATTIAPSDLARATLRSHGEVAMLCACNMNRSMAAHEAALQMGVDGVQSYGLWTRVKLPGRSAPHTFEFGRESYARMHEVLSHSPDRDWLESHGLLDILARNERIKAAPEQWQATPATVLGKLSVLVCFEDKVVQLLEDDLENRGKRGEMIGWAGGLIVLPTQDTGSAAVQMAPVAVRIVHSLRRMAGDSTLSLAKLPPGSGAAGAGATSAGAGMSGGSVGVSAGGSGSSSSDRTAGSGGGSGGGRHHHHFVKLDMPAEWEVVIRDTARAAGAPPAVVRSIVTRVYVVTGRRS